MSVKKTAGTVATLSLLLTLAACGGGGGTPNPGTLKAPQNVMVIPDNGKATVLWDAAGDTNVTGYNVYVNDQKVNSTPLPASGAQPFNFPVTSLTNGTQYTFQVVSVGASGEGGSTSSSSDTASPLVCERYAVKGTDMGALYQNISVSRGPASVTVNSTNIPASGGIYQGQLPAAMPVGGDLRLLTSVGDCLVFAHDTVPEAPAMTAPAGGGSLNVSDALPVTWTSGSNPDRFVVSATWQLSSTSGTGWRSSDLPGTARSFSIPGGTLPAGKTVKIRVYAYNDGTETFIGSYTADSRMAIRGGDEAGRDITTTSGPVTTNPPAVSWGDPHLTTLDQTAVEFQAVGEFDLTMSATDNLRVQARQRPWGGSTVVSINTAIATRMNGQKVGVYAGSPGVLRVGDAGTVTTVPAGGLDLGGGYRVTKSGSTYTFEYPGNERLTVIDGGGYLNAYLTLPDGRRGTMKGLWGNFDGNASNDLFLRSGAALSSPIPFTDFYGTYANSWRVPSASESLFVYDRGESFGGFDDPNFPSALPVVTAEQRAAASAVCTAAGVTNPITLEACIIDVSQTGNNDFARDAAATPAPAAQVTITPPAKPDLVVKDFSLALGNTCRPNAPFVTGTVTVKNVGTGPSPAISGMGMAQVVDIRDEGLTAGYRGNGVEVPALAPGASVTVTVPVYYPIATPEDTSGTRTYLARVDFGQWIAESDETNNRFPTNASITIPAGFCKNKVALVHTADTRAADVYKTELKKKGLNVTLVNASTLTPNRPADLAGYDLIAIDPLTGDLEIWDGGTDAQAAIQAAKKPMLGLGGGGYAFFGKINATLGWPRGASGSTDIDSIQATSPLHPVMQSPFPVNFTGGLVKISNVQTRVVAYHIQETTLETMGYVPGHTDFRMPAMETKSNTAQWSFYGIPDYTADGWNSMANLAWYLLR